MKKRVVTLLFSLLLFGCGMAILLLAGNWGGWIAGLVLCALGSQGAWAARMDKPSWLERIGPLP